MIDQDLKEFVIVRDGKPVGPIVDGDSVVLFNFRGDRAIEIARAFDEPDLDTFNRGPIPDVRFAGIMQYDEALLRETFEAGANLQASLSRGLYNSEFDRWVRFTDGTPPADTTGYRNEITWIEVAGNAAVARTDLWWPNIHYVDYLSLLKIGDTWKIVNKIWFQERP